MNEPGKAPRIEVKDIDHLGIVTDIVGEVGLVEEISTEGSAAILRSASVAAKR